MRVRFCDDDSAAAYLYAMGLDNTYKNVHTSEIDVAASRKNKARTVSLVPDAVDQYASAMEAGAAFPAIVLAKTFGVEKYIIASGNNRHEAATRLGEESFYALVIEGVCTDEDFDLITKGLNAIETACPVDKATRIEQAATLVRNRNMNPQDAAKALAVGVSSVKDAIRLHRVVAAAAKVGITIKGRATGAVTQLDHFIDQEPVFKALGSFVAKRDISLGDMKTLVKDIKASKTEAAKLKVIQDRYTAGEPVKHARRSVDAKPVRARILGAIASLENALSGRDSFTQLQFDSSETGEVLARWRVLSKTMTTVLTSGTSDSR